MLPSEILGSIHLVMASCRCDHLVPSDERHVRPFFHEAAMWVDLPPRVETALHFLVSA